MGPLVAKTPTPETAAKKPMSAAEQRRRFEETARELGCDEGQALDRAFPKIVPPKLPEKSKD